MHQQLLSFFGDMRPREYVISRLSELLTGYNPLENYSHNGGGSWNGKPWTSSLPSDAEIILNLFCAYMNLNLFRGSFKKKYFIQLNHAGKEKSEFPKSVALVQTKYSNTYVMLVGNAGSLLWPVKSGNQNVFHALVLFLYYVKYELSGRLDGVGLFDKSTQLHHVLSENTLSS